MKTGIHPAFHQITVSCACGNTFPVGSTRKEDLRVEICANCHPLYTGKAKLVDTTGRVDRFQARQEAARKHQEANQARLAGKTPETTTEAKTETTETAGK